MVFFNSRLARGSRAILALLLITLLLMAAAPKSADALSCGHHIGIPQKGTLAGGDVVSGTSVYDCTQVVQAIVVKACIERHVWGPWWSEIGCDEEGKWDAETVAAVPVEPCNGGPDSYQTHAMGAYEHQGASGNAEGRSGISTITCEDASEPAQGAAYDACDKFVGNSCEVIKPD